MIVADTNENLTLRLIPAESLNQQIFLTGQYRDAIASNQLVTLPQRHR